MIILASLGSLSAASMFWTAFTACVGGVLVFCGLWIEKRAEKEAFADIRDFWRQKRRANLGWWLLMLGIALEIVTACALAVKEEMQMKQIRIAEARNDPRNQPISDMSASAILIVMGTDFNDLTNWDSRRVARLSLWNDERTAAPVDALTADNFTRNDFSVLAGEPNAGNSREYGIRFRSFNFRRFMGSEETPARAIDDIRFVRMELNFLPHGSKIGVGGVDLIVNNIHKLFQVLPQIDTNPPAGTPGVPYVVIATNMPESKTK